MHMRSGLAGLLIIDLAVEFNKSTGGCAGRNVNMYDCY